MKRVSTNLITKLGVPVGGHGDYKFYEIISGKDYVWICLDKLLYNHF